MFRNVRFVNSSSLQFNLGYVQKTWRILSNQNVITEQKKNQFCRSGSGAGYSRIHFIWPDQDPDSKKNRDKLDKNQPKL